MEAVIGDAAGEAWAGCPATPLTTSFAAGSNCRIGLPTTSSTNAAPVASVPRIDRPKALATLPLSIVSPMSFPASFQVVTVLGSAAFSVSPGDG